MNIQVHTIFRKSQNSSQLKYLAHPMFGHVIQWAFGILSAKPQNLLTGITRISGFITLLRSTASHIISQHNKNSQTYNFDLLLNFLFQDSFC